MKYYDFKKAAEIINRYAPLLQSASMGMHEDWFWTADTVWDNGEFKVDMGTIKLIGGIDCSQWATPALCLEFKDGTNRMLECWYGDGKESEKPEWLMLGCMSQPVQDNITPLENEEN